MSIFTGDKDFKGKRVYVVGLGEKGTGRAVAQALSRLGARVTAADEKPADQVAVEVGKLNDYEIDFELGHQAFDSIGKVDLVVVSPGVPLDRPPIEQARSVGIPVVSEVEVAYWLSAAPIIAVTGTKGKTTTTALLGQLLLHEGFGVRVGGNIGSPLIEHAARAGEKDVLVAEISSFQLEGTVHFRPRVAALLNFAPDHLDRHGSTEDYWRVKTRIFANQSGDDFAVLNAGDARVAGLKDELHASVMMFSRQGAVRAGCFVSDGSILAVRGAGPPRRLGSVEALRLPGWHNLENALAALTCACAAGASLSHAEEVLAEFEGVPHRLEEVAEIGGVTFINDSQATVPSAVVVALQALHQPIILIAGGQPKVSDYSEMGQAVAHRVKALIVIGQAGPQIAQAASRKGFTRIEPAASLPEAVRRGSELAEPGDVVLLSPGCASFDQFKNMEHRGQVFKEAVAGLNARCASGAER